MIRSLDEAISYTLRLQGVRVARERRRSRRLRRQVDDARVEQPALTRPGCGPLQLAALLREMPGLPSSYVAIVEAVTVAGVRVGSFGLSPPGRPEQGLRPRLLRAADPEKNLWAAHHQHHHVYEVGLIRRDPIAVAGSGGHYRPGQVVWYGVHGAKGVPLVLAEQFEQFVLLAANLDAIRRRCDERWGDVEAAVGAFGACVRSLTGDDELVPVWRHIASEMLDLV